MKTFRQRVRELVLDFPEDVVLEEAAKQLEDHGEDSNSTYVLVSDVAWVAAAMVLFGRRCEAPEPVARVFQVTLTDGVSMQDG